MPSVAAWTRTSTGARPAETRWPRSPSSGGSWEVSVMSRRPAILAGVGGGLAVAAGALLALVLLDQPPDDPEVGRNSPTPTIAVEPSPTTGEEPTLAPLETPAASAVPTLPPASLTPSA